MNKSPLPNTRAFHLIWQVAPFLDWLFRSIRWRVRAVWFIGYWFFVFDAGRYFYKDRGKFVKDAWIHYCEREFPPDPNEFSNPRNWKKHGDSYIWTGTPHKPAQIELSINWIESAADLLFEIKEEPPNYREHVEYLERQLGKSFGMPECLGIPPELVKGR